jgi:hypothetical protein
MIKRRGEKMMMRLDKLVETLGYSDDELEMTIAGRFYLEGVEGEGFDE